MVSNTYSIEGFVTAISFVLGCFYKLGTLHFYEDKFFTHQQLSQISPKLLVAVFRRFFNFTNDFCEFRGFARFLLLFQHNFCLVDWALFPQKNA